MTPAAALSAALSEHLAAPPARLGLAVSGGGDSTALAALMADWAAETGVTLAAVTVDHGLRADSGEEAAGAARHCAALGIAHVTLRWRGAAAGGNLQDRARRARGRLIAEWAAARGITHVALGHTRDDQAETLLLRLARGSGVDGLSGMAGARAAAGVVWLRPLLAVSRAALRDELSARGTAWAEDPSNDDARFERVKARRALAALAPLGIDAAGLAATALRLRDARSALELSAQATAWRVMRVEAGDVVIARAGLEAAPAETRARLVAHALCWVSSAEYRPRRAKLDALIARIAEGRGGTLHGCRVLVEGARLRVTREWRAVRDLAAPVGALWDGRWRVKGRRDSGLQTRALGPGGLAECPGWRAAGLPRASLQASPALWRGPELVAAPLAGAGAGWHAELARGTAELCESLLAR